ncbi:MAG: hypothetical protein DDG60_16695 [Anaerolineae bacterium]|nr:MAG: hypothetical protein DDG60_16695 [Anaerolineae bacterium]
MARIEGKSGSWQAILNLLAEIGLQVESPEEIAPLLGKYRHALAEKTAEAAQKAREQLQPLEEQTRIEKENIQQAPAERLAELEEDIRQSKLHLELFRLDRSITGRVRNLYRIRREEKRLARLEAARAEIISRVERLVAEQEHLLAEKRAAIEAETAQIYSELNIKITTLQKVLDSRQLADALLEIEMLEHLRALPESAWVLNGIHLEMDGPVKLDGKSFWSAKMDHLVITPAGLFAVNVWRGGKPETGEPDPLEQVRRAAHLCYELLKFEFPGLTARAVLACPGHAPESPHAPYVKILPLGEVNSYIKWFKDNSLTPEQVEQIAAALRE